MDTTDSPAGSASRPRRAWRDAARTAAWLTIALTLLELATASWRIGGVEWIARPAPGAEARRLVLIAARAVFALGALTLVARWLLPARPSGRDRSNARAP